MKKSPWIVVCLAAVVAGLLGQMTAFGQTTTALYNITSTDTLAIGGFGRYSRTVSETGAFLSDGTFNLHSALYDYSGTYTLSKNGKQIVLALDASSLSALESNTVDLIQAATGLSVSVTIQRVTLSKLLIKNGVPYKEMVSIRGKGSAVVDGKLRSRGFSLKSVRTNWVLVSGTTP